ncbi:MAG TPA: AAA family ATPase [Gemmatimonadales bacterium]
MTMQGATQVVSQDTNHGVDHGSRNGGSRASHGAALAAPEMRHRALRHIEREPFYVPFGDELSLFERCHERGLAVMLKGPTGCGKTRFVEHMAWRLGRPVVTVACHDDLSASDLTGRWLVRGGETVWQDGPLTLAARLGAICYLDEVVEARQDTIVVIHPLTDDRRILPLDKAGELIEAAPGFQLVVSYNPGYQHVLKDLKPSTRQRFVAIDFDFPPPELEARVVSHEGGVDGATARSLVSLAARLRNLRDRGLAEVPSSRVLVATARLIAAGIPATEACRSALVAPLTDDPELLAAMHDLVAAVLG